MERWLLPPLVFIETLEKYASYLGLKKGSDDWAEFFDLAAAGRSELPRDLAHDAAVVKKLPLIFRTIPGKNLGENA